MKKAIFSLVILFLVSASVYAQSYTPPIGSQFQGGIVAYILKIGDSGYVSGEIHGLIAAPSDQSTTGIQWFNGRNILTGAAGTALGTGITNTNIIVSKQGTTLSYAARLCAELVLNGYYDWYLPSKDELNKLFQNRFAIGGFTNNFYWSSSENGSNFACYQFFDNGTQGANGLKNGPNYVRAVRSF